MPSMSIARGNSMKLSDNILYIIIQQEKIKQHENRVKKQKKKKKKLSTSLSSS